MASLLEILQGDKSFNQTLALVTSRRSASETIRVQGVTVAIERLEEDIEITVLPKARHGIYICVRTMIGEESNDEVVVIESRNKSAVKDIRMMAPAGLSTLLGEVAPKLPRLLQPIIAQGTYQVTDMTMCGSSTQLELAIAA